MATAEERFAWIKARHDEGRTVYVQNYLHVWKIAPKHRETIRLNGRHVELQHGKRWDSINGCALKAI